MHIPTAPAGLIPCLSKPNNKKEARVSPSVLTEGDIPILLWKSVQNRLSALRKSERDHYPENDQGGFIQGFLLSNSCFAPLQSLSHGGIFLWRGSIRIILGFVQFLSTATVIDDHINHGVVMLQTHSYHAHSGCNLWWTIPHRSAWSGLFVPFLIYSKPVSDPTPRGAKRIPLPTWVPRFAAYRKK